MNYGDKELVAPFLKVDSDSGKVSTSMDIDREKYDVSNYFEVSLALHGLVTNSSTLQGVPTPGPNSSLYVLNSSCDLDFELWVN